MAVTKHSKKFLPEALKAISTKNQFSVCPVDDGFALQAWDTVWGGGSRTSYYLYQINPTEGELFCETLTPLSPGEGHYIQFKPGQAIIEHVIFCGKDCGIRVTLGDQDVASFFGGICPRMPSAIAADWLQENGDSVNTNGQYHPGKLRKAQEAAAELCRKAAGLPVPA